MPTTYHNGDDPSSGQPRQLTFDDFVRSQRERRFTVYYQGVSGNAARKTVLTFPRTDNFDTYTVEMTARVRTPRGFVYVGFVEQ